MKREINRKEKENIMAKGKDYIYILVTKPTI